MEGEEAAEGSQSRRRMDLNLYLGLPPLPRPPGRLDVGMDCPAPWPNSADPAPEAPRTDEPGGLLAPEEVPPPPAVYSPSNAFLTPELSLLDPMIFELLDGHSTDSEETLDAVEPFVGLDVSSDGANVSPPPLAGLEGDDDLEPLVERVSHPGRVTPAAGGAEMVSMRELRQYTGGAIEEMAPELRLQRLIQVSEHHRIVRSGPVNRNQRVTSPETERLVRGIQRSHSSLDASKRQKLDGDGKVGGMGAVKTDGCCGCNSSFECNICLETAKEPVVTPCGHLFCWSCLYQWLHRHSAHSECPVCKGEVLEVNVTPIYGRGGERDVSSNDVPPRPPANRSESLRQQLQMPDSRGIASMVRRLIENPDMVRGQAAPPAEVEVTVLPAGRSRARGRRQQRQDNNALPSVPAILLHVNNVAPESGNEVPLMSSNADNAARAVPTVPQQSSSMEQASTSSTMAVIVGEPAQSRGARPSVSTTTRRTRRQH